MDDVTAVQMLRHGMEGVKPTDHPRADDLLVMGDNLASTLATILSDLDMLAHGNDPRCAAWLQEAARRLQAQRRWAETILWQYHQVQADLGGEDYAFLAEDGTGIAYLGEENGNYGEDAEDDLWG